ncbi:hypothetical protein F2Q69_00050600 [Brassica cretica]|uniref:Secreted protein n=1 Tax=Brassica cretica TaxID=69181 RepID=A0A8S9PT91_BRACR|nr:hypothetical protein F2Q69_00050600 [Brassica cretica]
MGIPRLRLFVVFVGWVWRAIVNYSNTVKVSCGEDWDPCKLLPCRLHKCYETAACRTSESFPAATRQSEENQQKLMMMIEDKTI